MKKSDYRKFIIRGEFAGRALVPTPIDAAKVAPTTNGEPDPSIASSSSEMLPILREPAPPLPALLPVSYSQNDDFASMRETVTRRYRRVLEEKKPMPSLILIDGGVGQLHAAAVALESLQIINQPLASIAKKEEILYIYGQENEPCKLDRHSPVLHLIQQIRDETHRFAVTFHRLRRGKRQTKTALSEVPGIGPLTAQKLLREFGSVANMQRAGVEGLSKVISRKNAEKILAHLESPAVPNNLSR
jgi:hypothetical protein